MLSHNQGVFLSRFLTVGTCTAIYSAIAFFIMMFVGVGIEDANYIEHPLWPSIFLWFVILCDAVSIMLAVVVGVKAMNGKISLERFRWVAAASLLTLLAANYVATVVVSYVFHLSWSLL